MSSKRVFVGTFALAAVVVAALTAGFGNGRQSTSRLSNGSVAALERPKSADDALAARVLALPFASQFSSPDAARLVSRDTDRSVYVVPGGDDGTLCLVVVEASEIGLNCAARSLLRSGSVWQGTRTADGAVDIVGVVGDGVAYVSDGKSRVAVKENAFAIDGVIGETLVLGTSNGVEAEFDLGSFSPPE